MNSNFNDKQIQAYAAAFEEGDAILCYGEWQKVKRSPSFTFLRVETSGYIIKDTESEEEGVIAGFKDANCPYRVTTLADYELQGGEKLVWLGECIDLTFGEIYVVESDNKHSGGLKVTDDAGDRWLVGSTYFEGLIDWAVIPRYEQVKKNEESKFKKGDKVLVNGFINGTVVETLNNQKYLVSIVFRSGVEDRIEFNEYQLEPAIEEPPAPKLANEQSQSSEIALDEVAIHSEIITRLVKQTIKGVKKYGDPVQHDAQSTVEWIDHAIDESIDQIVYLTALKQSLMSKGDEK